MAQADDEAATSRAIREVYHFLNGRRGAWRFENAGFAVNRRAKVGRRALILNYKIHANRVGRQRIAYRASLTIWPARTAGSKESLFPLDWRKGVVRRLKRHGYHGEFRIGWRRYYFGDFWKKLTDLRALAAEARQLEAWAEDPDWLPPADASTELRTAVKKGVGRRRTRG